MEFGLYGRLRWHDHLNGDPEFRQLGFIKRIDFAIDVAGSMFINVSNQKLLYEFWQRVG